MLILSATAITTVSPQTPAENPLNFTVNAVSKTSPNGKLIAETYGQLPQSQQSGIVPAEGIRIIDKTGNVLWSMEPGYFMSDFVWSPDSRFVAIYYQARIYGNTVLIDIKTMSETLAPEISEILKSLENPPAPLENRPDPYIKPIKWLNNTTLLMSFQYASMNSDEINGSFMFDPISKKISNSEV